MTLRHDAPGRLVTAMIFCRYFRDRTNFISREDLSYTIQPDWRSTFSAAGWGSLNAGTWRAGTYFISCNDGQKTLSESTFEVF